jgi:hypothetical protein
MHRLGVPELQNEMSDIMIDQQRFQQPHHAGFLGAAAVVALPPAVAAAAVVPVPQPVAVVPTIDVCKELTKELGAMAVEYEELAKNVSAALEAKKVADAVCIKCFSKGNEYKSLNAELLAAYGQLLLELQASTPTRRMLVASYKEGYSVGLAK